MTIKRGRKKWKKVNNNIKDSWQIFIKYREDVKKPLLRDGEQFLMYIDFKMRNRFGEL